MNDYQDLRLLLNDRLAEISGRLQKISGEAVNDREALNPDFAEQAVERENEEVLEALDGSIRTEIEQIRNSLKRLDSGEYGNCAVCGTRIPLKRLQALPFATSCVSCAK